MIPSLFFRRTDETLYKPLLGKKGIFILDGAMLVIMGIAPFLCKVLLDLPFDCWVTGLGFLCPACGGTRSIVFLLQGKIPEAFRMNPYFILTGFVVALGIIAIHLSCVFNSRFFTKISRGLFHPYSGIIWAIGWMLFGVLRNIIS